MFQKGKVALFSPVRQDSSTLALALASHEALKGVAEYWYADDNDDPDSSILLRTVKGLSALIETPTRNAEQYDVTGDTHKWTNSLVSRISQIRNSALDKFLESDCEFLFIVDSDVIVHPDLVEHLISLNLPVVSEVFWSQWLPGATWLPNVWDTHPSSYLSTDSLTRLRDAKEPVRVGGLGACTLIHRNVIERGVRYDPIKGLESVWGEDRWFCTRASVLDIPLYADCRYTPFHVYRVNQLEEARIWFEQGCQPEYFREVVLTEEWIGVVNGMLTASQACKDAPRKLAICIPGEQFSGRWMANFADMYAYALTRCHTVVFNCYSSNPSITRQRVAKLILEDKFDYVLWIDDDNIVTKEHFEVMLGTLEAYGQFDAVAGWCLIGTNGYVSPIRQVSCGTFGADGLPVSFSENDMKPENGLMQIGWTGFPAVMMRYSLLEKLGYKSFTNLFDESLEWGFIGEDVSFSIRARQAGAVMVVDPRLKLPHLKLSDANNSVVTTETISVLNAPGNGDEERKEKEC